MKDSKTFNRWIKQPWQYLAIAAGCFILTSALPKSSYWLMVGAILDVAGLAFLYASIAEKIKKVKTARKNKSNG